MRTETKKELSFEIDDFHPYSEYECVAQVRNENAGLSEEPAVFSPESEKYTLRTKEGSELIWMNDLFLINRYMYVNAFYQIF